MRNIREGEFSLTSGYVCAPPLNIRSEECGGNTYNHSENPITIHTITVKNAVKNRACRSSGTPCLYVIFYLFSGIRQIRPPPHQPICLVRTASADPPGPVLIRIGLSRLPVHQPKLSVQVLIRTAAVLSGISLRRRFRPAWRA